ncbi:MAG: hypothetical protein K0S04_1093 [Herbinix sp.]|jgi:hypothetical protein|nr:hypothetical protein [Herbinix sp.]
MELKDKNNLWWMNRPWRLIQPNTREIDMKDMNAEQFVADLLEFKANVVMLSTSGIVANYPTKLPFHFQNPYATGDSLKKIIQLCHAADIKVIARMDFSKIRREIHEKNPDWAFTTSKGETIDYNGDIHVCFNSSYQQELSLKIMKETIEDLEVDGIYLNMDGYNNNYTYSKKGYSNCHCKNCRDRYLKMYNEELPDVAFMEPVPKNYQDFKSITVKQHKEKMYRYLMEIKPDLCIANNFDFRSGFIRNEAGTIMGRTLGPYLASKNTKAARTVYPNMVSSTTSVDFMDIGYRHTSVSPFLQERRLLQSLSNGGGLDYYLIGKLDNHEDKSAFEKIKSVYHYHAKNESDYINVESVADIALFQSEDKLFSYLVGNDFMGWFRFLTENHYLFNVLSTKKQTSEALSKYKVLIIPEKISIDSELAARIDAFVSEGGTLISSCQSAFKKENGKLSTEPIFKSLGIIESKNVMQNMKASYLKIESKDSFPRSSKTELIYVKNDYIVADYEETVAKHMKLIPPFMFGPPERCYYTRITDEPGFTINPYGKGRGVYIPWCPGEIFCEDGHSNTIDFIDDLLESVLGITAIGGNASQMVEMTVLKKRNESSMILHLINGSGFYGNNTYYEPVTMAEIEVVLPGTELPKSIKSLVNGKEYSFKQKEDCLLINVDKLKAFDAIKISY